MEGSKFLNHKLSTVALVVYVRAMQRTLRTVSVERACEEFIKDFGPFFGNPDAGALQARYNRAMEDFLMDNRKAQ